MDFFFWEQDFFARYVMYVYIYYTCRYLYIIYLYILLGIPGILPISQDEGWRIFWISAKGYGLTMQTFATDLFSLSIETIYLMFWKDVFLLQKHLTATNKWVFWDVFPSCLGSPQRHVWLFPTGFTNGICAPTRHVGVVPWCFLSCHQGEGQQIWCRRWCDPFKTPNGIFVYGISLWLRAWNGCVLFTWFARNCILASGWTTPMVK